MADPFVRDADWNPRTDVVSIVNQQFIGDIIAGNLSIQKTGHNGWTEGRTMRLEGRIPIQVYNSMGLHRMDKAERHFAIEKLLNEHPEYRTVERLVNHTANEANIIIR